MSAEVLLARTEGRVRHLTFNRPDAMNAAVSFVGSRSDRVDHELAEQVAGARHHGAAGRHVTHAVDVR